MQELKSIEKLVANIYLGKVNTLVMHTAIQHVA